MSNTPSNRPRKVLWVEDDSYYVSLLEPRLKLDGIEIHHADNFESASNKINSSLSEFDAVLLDLMFPLNNDEKVFERDQRSGFKLSQKIRELDGDIPIFLFTNAPGNISPNDLNLLEKASITVFSKSSSADKNDLSKRIRNGITISSLPSKESRNIWFKENDSDSVFVFVHGVLSNNRNCWLNDAMEGDAPIVYWPDLLWQDQIFNKASIFLAGYYTGIDSGRYDVAACANEIYYGLQRYDERAVLSRKNIVFVCHSLGGVVIRYLLESQYPRFEDTNVGLVLLASPSLGSDWAKIIRRVSKLYQNEIGLTLITESNTLKDLDRRFQKLIREKRIKTLFGKEAAENNPLIHNRFIPRFIENVVPYYSAGRYFGEPTIIPNTDHLSIVKPDSVNHPSHQFLRDFYMEFNKMVNGSAHR